MVESLDQRHRSLPSQIALVFSSRASAPVGGYSRYLESKLRPLFPTAVSMDATAVRTPLLHVQRDLRSSSFRPRTECPPDVYRVVTLHETAAGTDAAAYPDLDQFDAVVVHTAEGRESLTRVTKIPVRLIPYGSYECRAIDRGAARRTVGIPQEKDVVFSMSIAEDDGLPEDVLGAAAAMPDTLFVVTASRRPRFTLGLRRSRTTSNVIQAARLSEDLVDLYAAAADVVVIPARAERRVASANPSLHRILSAGRPVVGAAEDRSLAEIDPWGSACRYGMGDADSLRSTLTSILADAGLAGVLRERALSLAAETSWAKVAGLHMELYGKTIGDFFGRDWYDQEYYVGRSGGKEYFSAGTQAHWSYFNPAGEWTGARAIMDSVKAVLNPQTMLSVGEGRGTFVAYARDAGIAAKGIDFSHWAVEHPYARAKGMVEWGDAKDLSRFPDDSFELVFASDLMEHIYIDDLPAVIREIQRVSRRWTFYNNGGTELGNLPPTFINRNELPPKELQSLSIAGHVILQPCGWWEQKLSDDGWVLRPDLVRAFRSRVDAVDPEILGHWKCIIIAEKMPR